MRLLLPPEYCTYSPDTLVFQDGGHDYGKGIRKERNLPSCLPMSGHVAFSAALLCVLGAGSTKFPRAALNIPEPLDSSKHFYVKALRDFPPPSIRMRIEFFDVWISHLLIVKIPNDIVLYNVYTE